MITLLHQKRDGTVGEEPDTDVGEVEMIALEVGESLDGWFLEHLLQDRGSLTATDKHTMVLRHRGIEPKTITNDISLRNRLQGLRGTDEHITTDHHRMDIVGCHRHHLFV